MLHSGCGNRKVKRVHERCLWLDYYAKLSSYNDLLTRDKSVPTHHKIFPDLHIGIFKVKNNLEPNIVNDLFYNETENHYNVKYQRDFQVPFVNLVYHGSKAISYANPKIWYIFSPKIKKWIVLTTTNSQSENGFWQIVLAVFVEI